MRIVPAVTIRTIPTHSMSQPRRQQPWQTELPQTVGDDRTTATLISFSTFHIQTLNLRAHSILNRIMDERSRDRTSAYAGRHAFIKAAALVFDIS